jgi:hypothetical protein
MRISCSKADRLQSIQIEGNPRPAQAGNFAAALNRVNPIERNTL